MKNQKLAASIIVYFVIISLTLLSCTTNSPTDSGPSGKGVTISISQEGVESTDYIGRDLNLLIKFDDSIVANISNTFAIQKLGANFIATEEMVNLTKVKKLTIPLYWINYAQLKIDSSSGTRKYIDSIYVSVFDDLNNETGRSNVVKVNVRNIPPQINTLLVGDSNFVVPNHVTDKLYYNYYLSNSSDSINIYVTAYDPDPHPVSATWNLSTNNTTDELAKQLLDWNSLSLNATYFVRSSSNIRDKATCLLSDNFKQEQIEIRFIRSDGNDTKVDSLKFGDTTFVGTGTKHAYKSVTIDTVFSVAYPHSEGGTPKWSATNGSIIVDNIKDEDGYAITYICKSAIKNDTIHEDTLIVIDTVKLNIVNSFADDSTITNIIIYKKPLNTAPIMDSILTDTVTQKPLSGQVSFMVEAGSTINLAAYAHDSEGGSVTYSWDDSSIKGSLSGVSGKSVTYTANDSMYYDTLIAIVTDSASFSDSIDVILFVDSRPVINSVKIDNVNYDGALDVIGKVTALDSFYIVVDATDPDDEDSLTYLWDNSSAKIDSIYYITADSTYDDTVIFTATDKYGLEASKEIIISVSKP